MRANKYYITCVVAAVMFTIVFLGFGIAPACKLYNGKLSIEINPPGASGGGHIWVNGTVGHHLVSESPKAHGSPSPWKFSEVRIVEGSFPPGLRLLSSGKIEGTPEQPGYWEATVVFTNVRCGGMELGDHYVDAMFTISAN